MNRLRLGTLIWAGVVGISVQSFTWANAPLLSAEQAFAFTAQSLQQDQAQLSWQIPEGYYLYRHQIQVSQQGKNLPLDLPKSHDLYDENYGHTQVYYQQLNVNLATQANQRYQVMWQGCAKDRICYPPQQIEFSTDRSGLVQMTSPLQRQPSLLDLSQNAAANSEDAAPEQASLAQDQSWSETLAERSFAYAVLLFLGLGFLLAFTPCSLPMLPIISSLLIGQRRGMQAVTLALTFVVSMALLYAVMGSVAASFGLGLQRWLQQPFILSGFALLFVLFALNLFGLFELHLPRAWVQRLDHLQARQRGGSYLGAAVLGALSALLVGPCMTAPLAGALLFIAQTQQQWQGAILLFSLGFGMGIPLLLISLVGSRALPAAGAWMNQVKHVFGFLMLAVALYFLRPVFSTMLWYSMLWLLSLSFSVYTLWQLKAAKTTARMCYLLLLVATLSYSGYLQMYYPTQQQRQGAWQVASNAQQFDTLLNNAPKNQPILIDVYADWCIACQPIEQQIFADPEVQQALQDYYLIKLDLSQYNAEHAALLQRWKILGPPTLLFLDASGQEQRSLRLVGSFSKSKLLTQLQQAKP